MFFTQTHDSCSEQTDFRILSYATVLQSINSSREMTLLYSAHISMVAIVVRLAVEYWHEKLRLNNQTERVNI